MRDLKYMYDLEKLLEDSKNKYVAASQEKGNICIASVCENVPEPLLNLAGTFSIRLRAPRTGSMEIGTYYLTNFLCEYTRALLERAIEGGYNFVDCLIAPDGCSMLNRCVENMELLHTMKKDHFFMEHMEIPMKNDENGLNLYVLQCKNHILNPLKDRFGIDISDSAILKSIELHNRVCELIRQIGKFRKLDNPTITGHEFHVLCLATYSCPKEDIIPILEETLEELKTRKPDEKNLYKIRVEVVGSEMDDLDIIQAIEESGAYVCVDRYCYGSFPGREPIEVKENEDPLTAVCRHYITHCQCARMMNQDKIQERRKYVADLAKEYKADGIIYEQMKFCDPWAYERMVGTVVLRDDYGYPVLQIDRPYANGGSGQIRTRVQAFVESVEIKKLGGKNNG